MKLASLNESIILLIESPTMTHMEITAKVLHNNKDFKKFLEDNFKPKTPQGKVDHIKALLSQPLNKIKKQLKHFIDNILGDDVFKTKYEPTLLPMKIDPTKW